MKARGKAMGKARAVPRPFAFDWGKGQVIEEATFTGPYHEPAIQLLEYEDVVAPSGSATTIMAAASSGAR